MPIGVIIDPEGLYTEIELRESLGLSERTLIRARQDGSLTFVKRGRRVLFKGRAILRWLDGPTARARGK